MDEALVAEDVGRTYGDVVALDGVSLSVARGEVFGLIGPNGAGKTTLVRALTGTTDADGEVRVLGAAPGAVDPERVGLLPQSFGPPERLTARELIEYYAGLYDEARHVDDVLADVGLLDDADVWYENLSGGQKRRVCVGTALVNDPEVLFLDEPTTGIDPAGRRALWSLVEDLADGGTTVFLTSHSMAEVERLADRVALMRNGEIVATGSPAALIDDHGGESRLVVRTATDRESADRESAEPASIGVRADDLATAIDHTVEVSDGELVVEDVDPVAIGDVVAALEAAGVEYESLTWTEPSLEDVYLRLTGESFGPELGSASSREAAVEPVAADGGRIRGAGEWRDDAAGSERGGTPRGERP